MSTFESCGVRIDALSLEDAAGRVVRGEAKGAIHLCNAYTLSIASRDPVFATRLRSSRLNLADGMPLVWFARWLGLPEPRRRVPGVDLMRTVVTMGLETGVRHYLYGSTPAVVDALRSELESSFVGVRIVGAESPPFGDFGPELLDDAAARFRAVGADVVWVGLGTPKQDAVVSELAARADLTFVAVGAAFDFISGGKRSAPRAMADHGFEWLFRLANEPRRLWRRYLVGNAVFVASNLRSRPRIVRREDEPSLR